MSLKPPKPSITIRPAIFPADQQTIHTLFTSYASNSAIYASLNQQKFHQEHSSLPGAYSSPLGAILLAQDSSTGAAVGCVALRPLLSPSQPHETNGPTPTPWKSCELKRLYALPSYRGLGIGKRLVEAALKEAERLGYQEVKLDMLPWMREALGLYKRLGLLEVEAYYVPLELEAYYVPLSEGLLFLARRVGEKDGEGEEMRRGE